MHYVSDILIFKQELSTPHLFSTLVIFTLNFSQLCPEVWRNHCSKFLLKELCNTDKTDKTESKVTKLAYNTSVK